MTNRAASFPAAPPIGPLHRHGGHIQALGELPIHALGDDYTVDGNGTITRLPALSAGVAVWLSITGTPTFTNSSYLICPGGNNYTAGAGDLIVARSKGSGVWQIYVLANAADAGRSNLYAAPFDALAYNGTQVDGSGDVSQLNGTTQLTLVSDTETYVTDTFLAAYKNSGAVVKARQLAAASFPAALSGYNNAVELKATTALSSLANGDYAKHIAVIEGQRVARLGWGASGAQPLAYAFQYYNPAASSKVILVKLSNSDRSRCYYDERTVAAGWNWVTPSGGYVAGDTSGTWDKTTGIGLRIEVFSAGKSAAPATPGSWGSTNTTASSGMTQNILDTTNFAAVATGLIVLPGIELPSAARAPLIMRPFDQEWEVAQRCYGKSYAYATAPGTASVANGLFYAVTPATTVTSSAGYGMIVFPKMRTAPSIIIYGFGGGAGKVSNTAGTDLAANSGTAVNTGDSLALVTNASGGTVTTNGAVQFHYALDARL